MMSQPEKAGSGKYFLPVILENNVVTDSNLETALFFFNYPGCFMSGGLWAGSSRWRGAGQTCV